MHEIQQKNNAELMKYIDETRDELRKLRFSASGSGVRNTRTIRNARKEIARSLTELNKRVKEDITNTTEA